MTEEKAVAKVPININMADGIVPKDYNELMQMAALLHASGLAPKSLDTTQKVAVAMMMCIELGRPLMTGIQDIAVINGKAGIFGDAALAIVRASGLLERFKEWEEGAPYTDEWVFKCQLKRKDMPSGRLGQWSWVDTKRAGFDKIAPPSPWAKYTRRMMQFKARNFPLRDEFGDVLKGMRLSEDNMDAIDVYPDDTGNFQQEEAATPPPPTEHSSPSEVHPNPDSVKFEDLKASPKLKPFIDQVDDFVSQTAEANGISIEEVQREAVASEGGFIEALKAWCNKVEEKDDPDEVTLFEEIKAMRPKTSEKNMRIFKEKILSNIETIRGGKEKDQDYARLKWSNTFPDEKFDDILYPKEEEEVPPFKEEQEQAPMFGAPQEEENPHVPPWQRRKAFLDEMKALHDTNKEAYFSALGGEGMTSANEVMEDAEQEAMILHIIKEKIQEA